MKRTICTAIVMATFVFSVTGQQRGEPNDAPQLATVLVAGKSDEQGFDNANDIDWYRFQLDRPSTISVTTETQGLTMALQLTAADAKTLLVNLPEMYNPSISYPNLPTGIYYLRASSDRPIGTYRLVFSPVPTGNVGPDAGEPNNSSREATKLTPGNVIEQSIVSLDDADWYRILLNDPSTITISTETFFASLSLRLYDRDATRVLVSHLESQNPAISYANLPEGTYYIQAASGGYVGAYRISLDSRATGSRVLSDEPNNTPAQATVLQFDREKEQSIKTPDDVDWFRFLLDTPASITVNTKTYGSLMTLQLYAPDAESLLVHLIESLNPTASYRNLPKGTYYLRTSSGRSVGSYQILLSAVATGIGLDSGEPNDTPLKATELLSDMEQEQSISYPDDIDWFRITLQQAGSIVIRTDTSGSAMSLQLYDGDAKTLLVHLLRSPNPIVSYRNLPKGTYYLRAFDGGYVGAYRIMLEAHTSGR